MRHIVIDTDTNQSFIKGRDGREHTVEAVRDAERRAAEGDEQAVALLETLEMYPQLTDPRELMMQMLHDCPQCRAALEAGEQPTFGTGEDLVRLVRARSGFKSYKTRGANRWRKRKQHRSGQ